MRMPNWNKITRSLALGVLALALSAPATAGTVFGWTTDEGIAAYTNDPKRVPARYKDGVRRIRVSNGLSSYSRFTPRDVASNASYEKRVYERVERLRALNAHLDASFAAANSNPRNPYGHQGPSGSGVTTLQLDDRSRIRVQAPISGNEPIVVDEVRMRADNMFTRHVTVVRQGDRVIAVERPASASQPVHHGDEDDLLR
jgi:hypothetical protein